MDGSRSLLYIADTPLGGGTRYCSWLHGAFGYLDKSGRCELTGETISHYRILEKVGEGGMGIVFRALDTRLGRTVAVKVLPSHLIEIGPARERLIREAQAAACLSHPQIATVFEVDEDDGQCFLVEEFIEGETLRAKLSRRPLPLEEALDIVTQVGEGLQAAHEKGIVHRDVKSGNIMIDPKRHVKVMDFGLAQLGGRTRITQTGASLGTPSYMSPEQAQGVPADHRADIWGLGVVLYEALSGELPFKGESGAAVIHSILYDDFTPLTALRSGLPIELDRILRKALAKDRTERYQHIDDFLLDLRALLKERAGGNSTSGAVSAPQRWGAPR